MEAHAVVDRDRPRFAPDAGFRRELDRRVADYFAASGEAQRGDWRMILKTATILTWFAGSYALLVFAAATWWQAALLAVSLAFSIAGVGFAVQHDANHGALSGRPAVNRVLERTLDLLGASSYLWRWKHNIVHHTFTNLDGVDNDIDLEPFARLAPDQRLRRVHRFQHIYMWVLYGFTVFHMHFVEDFLQWRRARIGTVHFPPPRGTRLFELFASKAFVLAWAAAVPLLFHRWWVVLVFYAAVWFAVGVILGVIFQIAHCVEEADFPRPAPDSNLVANAWAAHQVETTVDFAPGNRLLTWYLGGLNYQIEHHLFPGVCHIHYPAMSGIVQAVCADFGVRYRCQGGLCAAVAAHGRWLRLMGRPAAA